MHLRLKNLQIIILLSCVALTAGCRENYLAEKEFWKAERVFEKTLATAPPEGSSPLDLQPSVQAFEKVIQKYPGTPKAIESHFVITDLYIRTRNFSEARLSLERVIQNYSDRQGVGAKARFAIARLYEIEGRWTEAENAYWDAAEFHPYQTQGLYSPIKILLHYRQYPNEVARSRAYAKAMDYYHRMQKQTGPIEGLAMIKNYHAMAQLAYGEWEGARNTWLSIPKEFPKSAYAPMALLSVAEISWNKGQQDYALALYKRYFESYPNNSLAPQIATRIGRLLLQEKKYEQSREWFERALSVQKTNPSFVSFLKMQIGRSYQEEGYWDKAKKIYDDIKAENPDTEAALQIPLWVSNYYQSEEQPEKMQETLEEALNLYRNKKKDATSPDEVQFLQKLENAAYAQQGDWGKIIENFDKNIDAESSELKKGNWLFLKAFVYENRLKDPSKAADFYRKFISSYPEHPWQAQAKNRLAVLSETPQKV